MDKSSILSAHEFYNKYNVEEKSYDIFEEVDEGKDGHSGQRKKSAISSVSLDSAIKEPPKTHEELTKFLQEHLRITSLRFTSVDDQKQLADVLTWAITSLWPEHRKHAPDPFLSDIGNKELQRRIAVYIVQTAEELFYEYVAKAEEVNEKAVFSAEANLSRLKTQLLHEASTCLNALKVRRRLVAHMRDVPDDQWFQSGKSDDSMQFPDFGPLDSKTKQRLAKTHNQFIKKNVDEIDQYMKSVEQPALSKLLSDVKWDITYSKVGAPKDETDSNIKSNTPNVGSKRCSEGSARPTEISSQINVFGQRSSSMPNLLADFESNEEFKELNVKKERRLSVDQFVGDLFVGTNTVNKTKDVEKRSSQVKQDLKFEDVEDDDFSPLLQVQDMQPKKKQKIIQPEEPDEDSDEDLSSDICLTDEVEDGFRLGGFSHLPQPSFVNVKVPGKGIVRISDVSVSTRMNESVVTLHKYPTMYNEFLGEIDDATVKSLDEHLFVGKQAQEVYDEITKTMSKDFLCFDKDDFVEKCAPAYEDTSTLFMSSMLQEKQKAHLISDELRKDTQPPWSDFVSSDEWRNFPRFGGLGREQILQMKRQQKNMEGQNPKKTSISPNKNIVPVNSFLQKSYSTWLSWYKTHLDTDDYKKFLCSKANDYLCQLFHLYDSEDEEKEEEEDLYAKTMERQRLEELRKRKEEIRLQKQHYEKGYWNTQCVALGGLGKDPELEDEDSGNISDDTDTMTEEEKVSTHILLQQRLERVWKLLKTPEQGRVDMAMKYSDIGGAEKLTEAIEYWEGVTDLILERERLIGKLEDFERSASDPNRFFQKGPSGSSVARVNEAKTRETLEKSIKELEVDIKPMLATIQKQFGDIVTYQGRVYSQKLQTDRVEMLYWLQQERRQQALNAANATEVSSIASVKSKDIPPIIA